MSDSHHDAPGPEPKPEDFGTSRDEVSRVGRMRERGFEWFLFANAVVGLLVFAWIYPGKPRRADEVVLVIASCLTFAPLPITLPILWVVKSLGVWPPRTVTRYEKAAEQYEAAKVRSSLLEEESFQQRWNARRRILDSWGTILEKSGGQGIALSMLPATVKEIEAALIGEATDVATRAGCLDSELEIYKVSGTFLADVISDDAICAVVSTFNRLMILASKGDETAKAAANEMVKLEALKNYNGSEATLRRAEVKKAWCERFDQAIHWARQNLQT